MKPRGYGYNDEIDLKLVLRYLVRNRSSENWSHLYDVTGQLLSQLWPHRVPTSIYVRMKEDVDLEC